MPTRGTISGIVHVGLDILASRLGEKTKKILLQVGDVAKNASDGDQVEHVQHVGFASRPPKPVAGKASAQAVVLRTSDRDVAIGSWDLRGLDLYGSLDDGETTIYAAGEDGNAQGRILIKKNGSVNIYTKTGNSKTGKGMIIQIDAENDAIRITNGKGYGLIIDPDGVKLTVGGDKGGISLGSDGTIKVIATKHCVLDGDLICLGGNPALAAPLNSVCIGPAGISAVPSTKVVASPV